MSKSFIYTIVGLVLLSLAVFGFYVITHRDKNADLSLQQSILDRNLTKAKDKLNKAKATLSSMKDGFSNYFSFGVEVQDQMKKASAVVKQTNFLFTDPDGKNPEFIVKNLSNGKLLNDERRAINSLLAEWQKKTDVLALGKIDIQEAQQIKQDAERIKTYIEDIQKAVRSLTPENSGLSQVQINIYIDQLPSTLAIDKIIDSLSVAIIVQSPKDTAPTFQSSADTSNNTNTGENVYPTSINHTSPPFTPEQIIAQEALVAQYQGEVDVIQEQVAKVEEQIQQLLPPAPTPTPPATPPTPEPQPESGGVINAGVHRVIVPSTGIIIQPGPPRLIQGIDQY